MMSSSVEKKWYIAKVAPSKEIKTKALIEKKILEEKELSNKIEQVVVPSERIVKVKKDGNRIYKEKMLFPGYIFLQGDVEVIQQLKEIVGTPIHLMTNEDRCPIPMRKDEVNKFLNFDKLNSKETEESIYIPFLVGENVRIIEGPFESFCCSIIDINKETGKLKLEVMIFGRATNLELNSTQVEKI